MKVTGNRNQCRGCGEYFNSNGAFDHHRIGQYSPKERRCMTVDEMLADGMSKNDGGFWIVTKMDTDRFAKE